MSDCNSELVQLGDLPESLKEEVRRTTGDYVLPIVVDDTPLASGTLVQVDQWVGILTAEHVVNHPAKPELRLDWTGVPERRLRTAVGPFVHDLSIPTTAIRVVKTHRKSDKYGPDLAFVLLPDGPFLEEIKARKSIYNITLKNAERQASALAELGFFALCGFPAVRVFEAPPEKGFSTTHVLNGYAMFTGPEKYEERGDWDYYEIGVSQESADEFERTLGGVSGGAVWRVQPRRGNTDPPGSEVIHEIVLAGVAFYEMDDRPNQNFFVRAHGPRSIYETFVAQVRQALAC